MEFSGYDRRLAPIGRTCIDLHHETALLTCEVHGETKPHYEPVAEQFAGLAPMYVDGVAGAGALLLLGKGGGISVSQPGTAAFVMEELQRHLGEGPAVEAAGARQVVAVSDHAVETHWSRFTNAAVAETTMRSIACLPLYTHLHTWGALMLLADQPLDGDAPQAGEILATHTALTLEWVHHDRHYRSAPGSRDIIGQAKGVLMERASTSTW